ncbi:FAD binding domain-containing protein [Hirsutella rhossiliensis]|uniref:FAD binding domain-containing protein n=1 Tax=Hirsutella rhossiliensis TaxID=111463 RepID=A0A9P8MVU8_9HYPO|nr:FAD binding domain-containing protein [Hirsutella rhossiliensis]KAH0962215.1 FAD binding domain-containing protein [Hirsutella rhossiliensis]
MMALWMAKLGIKARVVDKRADKVFSGHADGLNVRTMEILDSFGIGERVSKESYHRHEASFWNPDKNGIIRRDARAPTSQPDLSRFTWCLLHQGHIETFLLDAIREASMSVHIDRNVMPSALRIDEEQVARANAHDSKQSPGSEGTKETVRARYLVGCDGTHSWVRQALGEGYEMVGETTDSIWGVLDIVPVTDFPDIRIPCTVRSASEGTVIVVPRENHLVRLYIQLKEVSTGSGAADRSKITSEVIFRTARRILSPYSLDYHYIDWWSAYQIGQRSGNRFSKLDRIFLAGDAVHTHSPKAGQGMNTAIQDTYNLGWKLGLVCKRVLRREVLATYELERRRIAKQLIALDQKLSQLFVGRPAKDILDETGVTMAEFEKASRMNKMFTTGIGIRYTPNLLNMSDEDQQQHLALATNCQPGTRFASHRALCQADARPWELHHRMPSDGRFRIVIFGGDISRPPQLALVNSLGAWLSVSLQPRFLVLSMPGAASKFKAARDPSVIDVLLVHSAPRERVELLTDLHDVYHPFDDKLGWDYEKTFADGHGRAYRGYGVNDKGLGAAVVVRPDGYVGLVTSLDEVGRDRIGKWFEAILRRG